MCVIRVRLGIGSDAGATQAHPRESGDLRRREISQLDIYINDINLSSSGWDEAETQRQGVRNQALGQYCTACPLF